MSRIRRLGGRLPSAARLVPTLLAAALMLMVASPAAAVGKPPSLTLDPGNAPAGAAVGAVAVGFAGCTAAGSAERQPGDLEPVDPQPEEPQIEQDPRGVPPLIELDPDLLTPRQPDLGQLLLLTPGVVVLFLDGQEVGRAPVTGDTASGTFTVPEVEPGEHRVQAVCAAVPQLQAAVTFVVDPAPPFEPVVVPDLSGGTVAEAERTLVEAGLLLGNVFGDGDVVEEQTPAAGTEVQPGDSVDVVLTGDVTVPRLIGRELDEISGLLLDRGLRLGDVAGDGDAVVSQSPSPGTRVPRGSVVSVDFGQGPPPPVTVPVPELVGLSVDQARDALSGVGLVLAEAAADGDGVIEAQDPPARALVPVGSAVTVTVTTPAGGSFGPESWVATVVVLAALLAASALGLRRVRSRRARRWVRGHVQVVPRPLPPPRGVPARRASDGATPHHVVRLEPHHDEHGTHVLLEVDA